MEKSKVQADFQLMDNYISQFELNAFERILPETEIGLDTRIGFQIINVEEEELIGQVELSYDIDIVKEDNILAKITIVMNALFKGEGKISVEQFEEMLKINGATTLSHLCRAYIHSATALSGMPTIMLPLINFNEFFNGAGKAEKDWNIM